MKKFILVMLLFSLPVFGADVDARFKNISLTDFLMFVSEFTGKSIVYDETYLKGTVTLDTRSKLTKENIIDIMHTVLGMNNLYVLNKGNYYQVMREADMKEYPDKYKELSEGSGKDLITSVLYFEKIDIEKVAPGLAKLKSKYGDFQIIKGLNVAVIRDTTDVIQKIKNILDKIESFADSFTFKSFSIKNSVASSIEKQVDKLFKQLKTQSILSFEPVLISDDATNTFIIGAKETDIKKVEYLIQQLDINPGISSVTPQVYYLKNIKSEDLQKVLDRILPTTKDSKQQNIINSKVASDKTTNSIIALGDKELYNNIQSIVQKLDVPRRQVYVEALILETTIEKGGNFGVEWLAGGGNSNFAGSAGFLTGGNLTNFQAPTLDGKSPNFAALPGGFTGSILGNIITYEGIKFPTLSALVNFVKTDSAINIISNPQILTLDNEEAEVFVGENRPFLTSTKFDTNNNPIQTYDYRDVGIRLKITPHISDNTTLSLKIDQEVKKVIANATEADLTAPITLTRQTKTNIELVNGYTMVISGLIGDDTSVTNSEVPGLSKIPLLGWLFKSQKKNSAKTNMMVFISAQIINTRSDLDLIVSEKKQYISKTNSLKQDNATDENF